MWWCLSIPGRWRWPNRKWWPGCGEKSSRRDVENSLPSEFAAQVFGLSRHTHRVCQRSLRFCHKVSELLIIGCLACRRGHTNNAPICQLLFIFALFVTCLLLCNMGTLCNPLWPCTFYVLALKSFIRHDRFFLINCNLLRMNMTLLDQTRVLILNWWIERVKVVFVAKKYIIYILVDLV